MNSSTLGALILLSVTLMLTWHGCDIRDLRERIEKIERRPLTWAKPKAGDL